MTAVKLLGWLAVTLVCAAPLVWLGRALADLTRPESYNDGWYR